MNFPYVILLIGLITSPCFTGAMKPKQQISLSKLKLDMCPECVELMDETIEQLLEYIASTSFRTFHLIHQDSGVIGGCSALCAVTGVFFPVCEIICDYVGIEVFVDVINKYMLVYILNVQN